MVDTIGIRAGTFFLQGRITFYCLVILICMTNAALADDARVIMAQGVDYVKLVPQGTGSPASNDHPYDIGKEEICSLLQSIEITREVSSFLFFDNKKTQQTMFNADELSQICSLLSTAYAKARANEDIIFAVSSQRETLLGIGKNTLLISARTFISDGKLNLIFNKVYADYDRLFVRESYGETLPKSDYIPSWKAELNPVPPGSRTDEAEQEWTLVQTPDIHYHNNRRDWIQINIAGALSHTEPEAKPETPSGDDLRQPRSRSTGQTDPATTRGPVNTGTLEQRLIELKDLYDKGLITEEIYIDKQRAILKNL